MDCLEVKKFVYVYLDNEFDEVERAEFEAHLQGCDTCRLTVDRERQFKRFFKTSIRETAVPVGLTRRIREELAESQAPRPLYRRFATAMPAAAIAMMVMFLFWPSTNAFTPIVEESIKAHQRDFPADVAGDANKIERFLHRRVNFQTALPLRTSAATHLMGARLSMFRGRPAVLYVYRHRGRRLTVVQFVGSAEDDLPQAVASVPNHRIHYQVNRGYTIAVYRHRGIMNSVVGNVHPGELYDLIPGSR